MGAGIGIAFRPGVSAIFDATAPVTQASEDVAATGTAAVAARRDHLHGMPILGAVGGTPAVVLGSANAAGVATTFLRTDDTIAAFDATAPTTSAVGDAAGVGAAARAARRDHTHGREAFATPALVFGTANAAGVATTLVRSDATLAAFDATAPTTSAVGDAAAVGTAAVAARRDHVHAREAFATPALVLSTTNAGGDATTLLRSNAQIAIFDATAPVTQASGDAAATGTAAVAARRDHVHGFPTLALTRAGGNTVEASTASTTDVDTVSVTVSIGATAPFQAFAGLRKASTSFSAFAGWKLNTVTIFSTEDVGGTGPAGMLMFVGVRETSYLRSAFNFISSTLATAVTYTTIRPDADLPTGTITAVVVVMRTGNAAETVFCKAVDVYSFQAA